MTIFLASLLISVLRVLEVGIGPSVSSGSSGSIHSSGTRLGFLQSLIFVLATGALFASLESVSRTIGFSMGFGIGTVLGL